MVTTTNKKQPVKRMDDEKRTPDTPVGIMADSHGRVDAIESALDFFKQAGCQKIFHLGDICDSFSVETADTCVRLLRENAVAALKGNNDHALVVTQTEAPTSDTAPETVSYLSELPLVMNMGAAVFAHSLPFVDALGFSCMIRTPQAAEARWFFSSYPSRILFRGHSHAPEIQWEKNGRLVSESIQAGRTICLAGREACIITCGALTRSICMTWRPLAATVSCHALEV